MGRSASSTRPRAVTSASVVAAAVGLMLWAGPAWATPGAGSAADSGAAQGGSAGQSGSAAATGTAAQSGSAAAPGTAAQSGSAAQDSNPFPESDTPPPSSGAGVRASGGSYWSVALSGGLLTPLGAMRDAHPPGLAAAVEIGWTAGIGLGAEVLAQYAPLPATAIPTGATAQETHFGAVMLVPRFTLGKHTFRLWIGGGGGFVLDYTRTTVTGSADQTDFTYEPAATGAAGLDLHIFTRGGLAFRGSYTQSFGTLNDRFYTATGGLLLTF